MKSLYVVETWRWVRAECNQKIDAMVQAKEYLQNYGGEVWLYHYIIENPDVHFHCEDWELCFFIDNDYIVMEDWEDYWIGRALLNTMKEPILDY